MARKELDSLAENRVRRIIREELFGISASIESDPIHNATNLVEHLGLLLSQPDSDVNLNEVRKKICLLRDTLPEIIEEINIIRDTFIDE